MSSTTNPVERVDPVAPVASREVRSDPPSAAAQAPVADAAGSAAQVRAALTGLGRRITFGGRVAEFAYDESAHRVVMKVYSQAGEPRELVRQIPPEEYVQFVSRFREFLGVLFDGKA